MVLQKRLDYGFNGHQAPFVPRAPRSIRKRGSIKKTSDGNSTCAIDLLATIAGKILLEGDISTNPSNIIITKNDFNAVVNNPMTEIESPQDETRTIVEPFGQVNTLKDSPLSVLTTCGGLDKEIIGRSNDFALKVEGGSCENMSIGTTSGDLFHSVHSVDHIGCDPFPLYGDHVKLVSSRDDDENSSGCTHPITTAAATTTTTSKLFRSPPRIGDRRIRKVLASKNWKPKVASRVKEEDGSHTSGELNPIYHIRKTCYKRQRTQRNYPFKKRRLFNSTSDYGRGNCSGGVSCSLEKGVNRVGFNPGSRIHGTGLMTTSAARQNILRSRDPHVKLRIKSFRVPELYIEISETATVGSLKRRVMEAVMDILGGGLRVGVLVQGKKLRDDNKTLLQTGISHNNQPDALGFALEPNSSQALDTQPLLPLLDAPEPLTRYMPPSGIDVLPLDPSSGRLAATYMESDHDSAPSPTDLSIVKNTTDSKAIVPVQAMNVEALSMVPMHRKSKRSDASQRRIRRPFSVSEVEALVHAVEKLGTGRWRDVKIRAFDNAKHRTYVDLKDKWKTLVHTARISPQQRRGEPVPQELLDRVLAAHAYWTQHQVKLQLKNQSETCLLL